MEYLLSTTPRLGKSRNMEYTFRKLFYIMFHLNCEIMLVGRNDMYLWGTLWI